MRYHELVLFLTMISAGAALAPRDSQAHIEAEHQHSIPNGYTRSVATWRVPDVKLVDADGKTASLHESQEGTDPVMLNFVCTACTASSPATSAVLSRVQARLRARGEKVRIVSVSVDPEHDTPARLQKYAKRFEAGPGWRMLTGSRENSIAIQRAFGIYRGGKMNHEPVIFMRNGPGQPWVSIAGNISADDLLREYRRNNT